MREQVYQAIRRIDALQKREKAMLLIIAIAAVWFITDTVIVRPISLALPEKIQKRDELRSEMESYRSVLINLEEERKKKGDPAAAARAQIALAQQEIQDIQTQMDQLTSSGILKPTDMPNALQQVLLANRGLQLESLKNLPPRALMEAQADAAPSSGPVAQIYRHSVELVFTGSYLDTLRYIQALEALPWRLFWDELDIHTEDYPKARVRMVISTLGLDAALLGV